MSCQQEQDWDRLTRLGTSLGTSGSGLEPRNAYNMHIALGLVYVEGAYPQITHPEISA